MAVIGIDLGTTNSLVAYFNDGSTELIPNVHGDFLTPSVVSLDVDNHILIGRPAKNRLITHPDLSKACFKRDMGTDCTYVLGDQVFRPVELSALLLRALKDDAERHIGKPVVEAVISVPAYFNEEQRTHTLKAAKIAGLHVERIINEPTAAALSYGIQEMQNNSINVILDLGGGTFDVTIMEYFEGIMEVRATGGNSFLGGEDFTALLINDFKESHPLLDLNVKNQNRLHGVIEEAKKNILTSGDVPFEIDFDGITYHYTCTNERFVDLAQPFLKQIRTTIERCVRDAQIETVEIDRVILVGGASRMICFRECISKMFGLELLCSLNPDEVVAIGAAIQSGLKQRNAALKDIVLTDVAPHTLGIETASVDTAGRHRSGYFSPIIERNTTVPVSRVQTFTTVQPGQLDIAINIFQGESRLVDNNHQLGALNVTVPKNKKERERVDVRFTYDVNGLLEVEAVICSTGSKKALIIEKNSGELNQEYIEKQLERLAHLKVHPAEKQIYKELLSRADRCYLELAGDQRAFIQYEAVQFEAALDTQNEKVIDKAFKKLNTILKEYYVEDGDE